MRDAAVAGLGIALLPSFVAGASIKSGALRAIDIGVQAYTEHIYVAHPEGRRTSAKLKAFIECLRKAFGEPPYWDNSAAPDGRVMAPC